MAQRRCDECGRSCTASTDEVKFVTVFENKRWNETYPVPRPTATSPRRGRLGLRTRGNKTNTIIQDMRASTGQPFGLVQLSKRYTIWARTWAELIGDAKHRHKYVQRSLDYTTDHDQGVAYRRKTHSQYLPEVMTGVNP